MSPSCDPHPEARPRRGSTGEAFTARPGEPRRTSIAARKPSSFEARHSPWRLPRGDSADRCRARDQRERFGFARRQAGQIRRVTLDQADAAAAPRFAVDGHTHRRQRIDISENRAHGDIEPLGEIARGEWMAALQGHENREQPFGAHGVPVRSRDGIPPSNHDIDWHGSATSYPPATGGVR